MIAKPEHNTARRDNGSGFTAAAFTRGFKAGDEAVSTKSNCGTLIDANLR
jgi:hypothetical protein